MFLLLAMFFSLEQTAGKSKSFMCAPSTSVSDCPWLPVVSHQQSQDKVLQRLLQLSPAEDS